MLCSMLLLNLTLSLSLIHIYKFYSPEELAEIKTVMGAKDGDLVLILSGDNANKTRIQLFSLRLEMGDRLGLRDKNVFKCLWTVSYTHLDVYKRQL